MESWLIRGATVIDPSQKLEKQMDVLLADGVVRQMGEQLEASGARVLDAAGLVCAPGLVDMHVHLREPGQTHKEDIHTGCEAAAAGGVTSLACMPNTTPAADTPAVIQQILTKASTAKARVYPVGAITRGLAGEQLTDFEALRRAGAAAVSDDGRPVPTGYLMRRALENAAAAGLPLLSHSEELSLVQGGIMNEGAVSRELGVPGIFRGAEDAATAREIALAAATGCPVHICHVSTAGSVALLRDARRRGVPVTGETAPHYFALTDDCLRGRDADCRMNPPLRTAEDVEAVIEGVRDGTLSAIATDHAPHAPEEKADFLRAPNGSVGLETSLAAGITYLVRPGYLTMAELIDKMSTAPARLLGLPGGTLREGAAADVVLFDPAREWVVDPARFHGKSRNSAFKGRRLNGRVRYTFLGGRLVYKDEEEEAE